jgi:hypothetical protein
MWLASGAAAVHALWGAFLGASFPFDLPPESYAEVPEAFVTRYEVPRAERALPQFVQANLPGGARILSENAYAHALLAPVGVEVVPIWSPEVAFAFDGTTPASTVRAKLRERGIRYVLYYPESPNTRICVRYAFFAQDLPFWVPVAQVPGEFVLYQMPG